jgi:hypothetical protein
LNAELCLKDKTSSKESNWIQNCVWKIKLVLKRAIECRIVFQRHHIDEPPVLRFSLNFKMTLEFDLKEGLGN